MDMLFYRKFDCERLPIVICVFTHFFKRIELLDSSNLKLYLIVLGQGLLNMFTTDNDCLNQIPAL